MFQQHESEKMRKDKHVNGLHLETLPVWGPSPLLHINTEAAEADTLDYLTDQVRSLTDLILYSD